MAQWGKVPILSAAVAIREDAKELEAMALEENWPCCEEVARRLRDMAQEALYMVERTREHKGV